MNILMVSAAVTVVSGFARWLSILSLNFLLYEELKRATKINIIIVILGSNYAEKIGKNNVV